MQQSGTKWVPSPAQQKVFEIAVQSETSLTVTELCEQAQLSRSTFYRWLEGDEGFREAWANLWADVTRAHRNAIVLSLKAKAQAGDVPAIRTFFELDGLLKQRLEHTGAGGGPIRTESDRPYKNLSTEELMQLDTLLAKAERDE